MAIKVWNNAGVDINARLLAACVALVCLGSCGSSGRPEEKFPTDPAPAVNGPAWLGFANNAQHTALSGGAAQTLGHIVWQKYVDLDPPDTPDGTMQTAVFYGADIYATAAKQFNATVSINTPITVDSQRNAFFGFQVTGANPAGLVSGIARVGAGGSGIWLAASDAAGDAAIDKVATNSAPALSADEQTLYVAVKALDNLASGKPGYLLALDAGTLAIK